MATPPTTLLKVSTLIYRDQSHDEETWKKWWLEEHMPRILPIALKHGIERAEVYFTPSSFKEQFQEHLENLRAESTVGWDMAPYDAEVIFWASDFQNIRNMFTDPDYDDKVRKFIEGWIDKRKVDVQVGTQTTFIEDGKIVINMPNEFMAASLI